MKKVSIAVIGCGRIGQMHAKNIQLHEQTNLVCIYDPNEEFAKKVSNDLSVLAVKNVDDIFNNNDILLGVLGEFNNNLKELEKVTLTSLYSRGNSIAVKGDAQSNEKIKKAIKFLSEQFIINGSIEKKDIHSSVSKFMRDQNLKINK